MKKFLLPASFLLMISLVSCGGESTETTTSDSTVLENSLPGAPVMGDSTTNTMTVDTSRASVNPGATQLPAVTPSVTPSVAPSIAPAVAAQQKSNGKIVQPNPEHGKPGHRCDIPVGAPLNSPVKQIETPGPLTPTATQPLQAQPQPQAQPAGKASGSAKLNPAHGQPGHDCAVPVGQPLKS